MSEFEIEFEHEKTLRLGMMVGAGQASQQQIETAEKIATEHIERLNYESQIRVLV